MTDHLQIQLFSDEEIEVISPVDPYKNHDNPMVRKYGTGPEGTKCKSCRYLYDKKWSRTYYKCELRGDTNGPGTDHRVNWQSCIRFEEES